MDQKEKELMILKVANNHYSEGMTIIPLNIEGIDQNDVVTISGTLEIVKRGNHNTLCVIATQSNGYIYANQKWASKFKDKEILSSVQMNIALEEARNIIYED